VTTKKPKKQNRVIVFENVKKQFKSTQQRLENLFKDVFMKKKAGKTWSFNFLFILMFFPFLFHDLFHSIFNSLNGFNYKKEILQALSEIDNDGNYASVPKIKKYLYLKYGRRFPLPIIYFALKDLQEKRLVLKFPGTTTPEILPKYKHHYSLTNYGKKMLVEKNL